MCVERSLRDGRRRKVGKIFQCLRTSSANELGREMRQTRRAPQYLPSRIISPTRCTKSNTLRHVCNVSMASSMFRATFFCSSRARFLGPDQLWGRGPLTLQTYFLTERPAHIAHLAIELPNPSTQVDRPLPNGEQGRD